MVSRCRRRTQDEKGFTLIELLVVMLIIGILAAIAIPSFLNQKTKAEAVQAKEMARAAMMATETLATENAGRYPSSLSVASVQRIEPTLNDTSGATLTAAVTPGTIAGGTNSANKSYTVTATASDSSTYSITRHDDGRVTRSCVPSSPNPGGCVSGSW